MMLTIPQRGRKTRWAAIFTGITVFLWLAPEDNHVWPAALLGALVSGMIVTLWLLGRLGGQLIRTRQALALGVVGGGTTGFGASLSTTLLMLLKNARHSHFFPDFPTGQMGAMLERAPIWSVSGALAGLGISLLFIGLKQPLEEVYTESDERHNEGT